MKALIRISIPERFQSKAFLKTASDFDVPNTGEGHEFLRWWEKAAKDSRDEVMQSAFIDDVSIVDAYKKTRTPE